MVEDNLEQEFAEALKDPDFLASLQRKTELSEFKEKYGVERSTPLKCPACSQWGQTGGALWIHKEDKNLFTCRKCKLRFRIGWEDGDIGELILKIREQNKEVSKDAKGKE